MKNKKTKIASLALALTMSASTILPAFAANEDQFQEERSIVEYKTDYRSNLSAGEILKDAESLRESLLENGAFGPYVKLVNKIIDVLNEVDLKSGGVRISLASDSLETILIATRDLTNKTETVHRKIGFAVTRAVIVMADPFASTDKIAKASENLKAVVEEAQGSPDITEDDLATVYVKGKLNELIKEAKDFRNHELKKEEYKDLKNELNTAINEAVKVKSGTRVKVGEINKAYQDLESTLESVKEKKLPIDEEVEAKENLDQAKKEADRELVNVRNAKRTEINKMKDFNSKEKSLAKKDLEEIFKANRDAVKAAESIESLEDIKNEAIEKMNSISPEFYLEEDQEVELEETKEVENKEDLQEIETEEKSQEVESKDEAAVEEKTQVEDLTDESFDDSSKDELEIEVID